MQGNYCWFGVKKDYRRSVHSSDSATHGIAVQ